MHAVLEEMLARDLIVLDRIDTDFFAGDALAGGFGRSVKKTTNWSGFAPLKNGPARPQSPR
jgi:hypothetical protein